MTTTRTVRSLAALALTTAALVGCAAEEPVTPVEQEDVKAETGFEIVMDEGLEFEPQELTVPAGSPIEVINRSSQAHTVTAADSAAVSFDIGPVPQGDTAQFTVDEPGRYEYFCRLHPEVMQAVLVVE